MKEVNGLIGTKERENPAINWGRKYDPQHPSFANATEGKQGWGLTDPGEIVITSHGVKARGGLRFEI